MKIKDWTFYEWHADINLDKPKILYVLKGDKSLCLIFEHKKAIAFQISNAWERCDDEIEVYLPHNLYDFVETFGLNSCINVGFFTEKDWEDEQNANKEAQKIKNYVEKRKLYEQLKKELNEV